MRQTSAGLMLCLTKSRSNRAADASLLRVATGRIIEAGYAFWLRLSEEQTIELRVQTKPCQAFWAMWPGTLRKNICYLNRYLR